MKKTLLLAALSAAAILPVPAFAQHSDADEVPIYEGTWTVRFADGQRAGRLVLKDWEGSWTETGPAGTRPAGCKGRKLAATVHHSNPQELEFTAWGSSIGPACPDLHFELVPVGGTNALEGTAGEDKAKVRLTRSRR
jgi:hypothetical protein